MEDDGIRQYYSVVFTFQIVKVNGVGTFHNGFAWMSFDNYNGLLIFALKMR